LQRTHLEIQSHFKLNFMALLKEFKDFAMRGNVIDLAVGVIIGGAFGKIIASLVADVIMPPIGLLVGGVNFVDLKWVMKPAEVVNGVNKAAVTMNYGNFLQVTFDFLIVAFCIFLFVKGMNTLSKKKEETPAPAAPAEPTKEEQLLTEIRDLLKK
jgi:large conductance mechanosensitive channel